MKHRARLLGVLLLLLASTSHAGEAFPTELDPPPEKRIIAADVPGYGPPEPAIKKRLLAQKKNNKTQNFCVVGYVWPDDYPVVWVHWREEQRLLLWRSGNSEEQREKGLMMARRNLKLGRDTVATQNEIGGSNYLTTHAWWHAVVDDCAAHGQEFTIKPFKK
jgi:hypothetical protein